jgi:predicted DNA-binding ribbon-helix-helix protein
MIRIDGRRSCISLESAFWDGLMEIAVRRGVSVSEVVTGINSERQHANLTSAVRLFVLGHYQDRTRDKRLD